MTRNHSVLRAAMLAALIGVAIPAAALAQRVGDDHAQKTNPGFDPGKGTINPGEAVQAPVGAPPGKNDQSGQGNKVTNRAEPVDTTTATGAPLPTPKEARAALLSPSTKDPSPGAASGNAAPATTGASGPESKATAEGYNAIGGSMGPGTSALTKGGSTGGAQNSETPPIGSIGQTTPAKLSKRNTTLDNLPIMAWPLPLKEEQTQRIFKAVMDDKTPAAEGADALKPASQLSTQQALNDMKPLPESLGDIAELKGLDYVKAKNKVLIVQPSTRVVLDEIDG